MNNEADESGLSHAGAAARSSADSVRGLQGHRPYKIGRNRLISQSATRRRWAVGAAAPLSSIQISPRSLGSGQPP